MKPQQFRNSGIDVVGNLRWGSHICVFYEGVRDLLDIEAAFFRAGLEDNEACIWAASPPVGRARAIRELRSRLPRFDRYAAKGQIEIVSGRDWYLDADGFNPERVTRNWEAKLDAALANGFSGLRISGNAFWFQQKVWRSFRSYEEALDRHVAGLRMLVLCTYWLRSAKAADILDVARAHNFALARRGGDWEFLETPAFARSARTVRSDALDVLAGPSATLRKLTPRERAVLTQIVTGASTKEAARRLAISPRTIEFHRSNILRKLDVRNVAGLIGKVLGGMPE